MFEFHISRSAREKYDFDQTIYRFDGNVIFTNFLAAREFAQKINKRRDLVSFPEEAVKAGDINAMGLIDEILHFIISLYRRQIDPKVMQQAMESLEENFGEAKIHQTLLQFVKEFPPIKVYQGEMDAEEYLESKTQDIPNKTLALEEMLMLWITNKNPAVAPFAELFDDKFLIQTTVYRQVIESLKLYFKDKLYFGPDNQDLYTMLRSPAVAAPHSLTAQLEYIRQRWGALLGDFLYRLLNSLDLIREENKAVFGGPGPAMAPSFEGLEDEENFSPDSDWMPRTVMIAKNTYVWLYQLSQQYNREIRRLDQIPDEELDRLAGWGFNGLWLIGLWERSDASKRIKQLCGNPEAVASAYSLKNYAISGDLGGEEAYQKLREKAWQRGIRLASDMVPNHMGIDSDWVVDHPDWFISLPYSPFPAYSFNGTDLSPVDWTVIQIEDHYYDRTDAAVVFRHINKHNGHTRFIYHGNDGTSMPWNDTAQLNYLMPEVREAVIQTILHVARKFPIIRFDAAMTLAKKHYQRLWYPQPGSGGDIASRAEHGLTQDAFDQAIPQEFWREVVERVAQEVPDTLLLAEAFWMMEGFFVRTLGMHRVYNSAFMNMLRNEDNAKYRQLIKNTLEFDPQILKRYVNFMNNPDEKTAVEQFGKGDKYFGICTLMTTMPGLPMFGHGQIQGFSEKYGMEYYRPYWDEEPDGYLIQRHTDQIFPLMKRRDLFSGVRNFLLYDFYTGEGRVDENVFAYSNGNIHQRGLVVYHNRYGSTRGWIHRSASYLNKDNGHLENKTLGEGLNLGHGPNRYLIFKDTTSKLEYIRSVQEIRERGLYFELNAYECHVFMDFREVEDNGFRQYSQLNTYLNGRGVPSINDALNELMLAPVLNPLRALINPETLRANYQGRIRIDEEKIDSDALQMHGERFRRLMEDINGFVNMQSDIQPIVREEQRGLKAILELEVFGDRYPFPMSRKYDKLLKYIQGNLGDYPFIWYILFIWNDLRLMGRVITSGQQYASISRSWLDEWGISRILQRTFEELGFDSQQSNSGINVIKLLISQQNWVLDIKQKTALSQMEAWLSEDEIRTVLNVNRYRGKLYFNKEAFETMMWWMMTAALIRLVADPEKSLAEDVEILLDAQLLIEKVLEAEKESEYQVEILLKGLK
jgi:glycosidase